jgi:hypothetical protein
MTSDAQQLLLLLLLVCALCVIWPYLFCVKKFKSRPQCCNSDCPGNRISDRKKCNASFVLALTAAHCSAAAGLQQG